MTQELLNKDRIDRSIDQSIVVGFALALSLLLCCCCNHCCLLIKLFRSIAAAVATDQFTAAVADNTLIWKNMKTMTNHSLLANAADQFFVVSPSKAKRIGVPPLLRTASATLCLWDCP